jgi:hypothetical protein
MAATGLLKDKNMKDMPTVPKKGTQTVNFDSATTSNRSTALPGNICFIRATVDCWIKRGGSAVTGVATAGDDAFFIGANDGYWDFDLPTGKNYIAPLAESGSGKIYIIETDEARN